MWTRDLFVMYQNTRPRYLKQAAYDEAMPWYEEFARRYGLELSVEK
jgi:hypothetical protein